jgi:hypothetical protein
MGPFDQQLTALKEEQRALIGSWAYAFAMGHGCSIGDHPQFAQTRRRAADLAARIAELGGDPRRSV